ncbi:MAG: hypothetical protein S4CHLAM7_09290 [Chlamydiae bacterium]|nr:hypothetical protein [Chlamydiota bacterium]
MENVRAEKTHGVHLDAYSRCTHYFTDKDIVSIKFKCCSKYYACYKCHENLEQHPVIKWERADFSEKALRCGRCQFIFSIQSYLSGENYCPQCSALFNPLCKNHWDIYFNVSMADSSNYQSSL